MTKRADKAKAAVAKNKAANQKAADKDQTAKDALVQKMKTPGGAGRLSKKELDLAKRMGEGEGKGNRP